MVFWLNSSDFFLQIICWGGAALSLLLIFQFLPRIVLLFLYLFYLSLITAGQMFMSFQWDLFLLETGVLAIFLVNYTTLGIWLLRWLLFRFMLAGGLVKIFSGDPTWQNFTALNYYFFTEPLPTPLAWYFNQLPQNILQFGAIATLVVELIFPFLIFMPRRIRFVSAYIFIFFQLLILVTGNYNFFNILSIVLCLILFDDAALQTIIPNRLQHFVALKKRHFTSKKVMTFFVGLFAAFTVFLSLVQFQLRFVGDAPKAFVWVYNKVEPLRWVNMYGPFAVMTTERMEIIIEGSDDGIEWKEYAFKYKPGDIYRRPLWNIPFQPRLDWQMWFAALGSADQNPWFYRLVQRILENSPDVMQLLGNNPFPDKPPFYIRAQFYDYRFTDFAERKETGAWWKRRLVKYYLPEVHLL